MNEDLLRRLVRQLEVVAERDAARIAREQEIAELRRESAFDLYAICSNLVRTVNAFNPKVPLELSPPEYNRDSFREGSPNVVQVNASGRLINIVFEGAEPLISTEQFLTPYTLHGSIRWFNQQSLEELGIREHLLFLCLDGHETSWVWFDAMTHRSGPFDEDYLAERLEELLR